MDGILIDSSVWIAFFRGRDTLLNRAVKDLLTKDQVLICPPVYQEVMQGFTYPELFFEMKERFDALKQIHADPYDAALGAAKIYSGLRSKGITVRKSYDCLIAWYSITFEVPLFHLDRDFIPISEHFKLQFYAI